jgi:hypothetical protein
MSEFTIYQSNIFRKLREGHGSREREEFFYSAIREQADTLARRCGAVVELNPTRIKEAQDLWISDLNSLITDQKIQPSPYPCEYKHAAFLCFWLRRRLIIETVRPVTSGQPIDPDFMEFKNEYVAFYIALNLVAYHAYYPKSSKEHVTNEFEVWRFPADLAREALVMLHHKNVSPHALYLFFKALMTNLPPAIKQITSVN